MYARIRAHERNFLTTNLLYNIPKPSSIISPTPFTSIIQSLYNPYQYWHHIGCAICTNCQHLPLICYILSSISNHYPTISQLFNHLSVISPFIITITHHLTRIIFHLYPISSPTHHLINMSVCYKTLSILYIFAALPYTSVSHLIQMNVFITYQIHYNHFHYGNRIPRQSSAIPHYV